MSNARLRPGSSLGAIKAHWEVRCAKGVNSPGDLEKVVSMECNVAKKKASFVEWSALRNELQGVDGVFRCFVCALWEVVLRVGVEDDGVLLRVGVCKDCARRSAEEIAAHFREGGV